MKLTTEILLKTKIYLEKIGAKDVILEICLKDLLEIDNEIFDIFGVDVLKGKKQGDTIELCGIKCLITFNEGIKIIIK